MKLLRVWPTRQGGAVERYGMCWGGIGEFGEIRYVFYDR